MEDDMMWNCTSPRAYLDRPAEAMKSPSSTAQDMDSPRQSSCSGDHGGDGLLGHLLGHGDLLGLGKVALGLDAGAAIGPGPAIGLAASVESPKGVDSHHGGVLGHGDLLGLGKAAVGLGSGTAIDPAARIGLAANVGLDTHASGCDAGLLGHLLGHGDLLKLGQVDLGVAASMDLGTHDGGGCGHGGLLDIAHDVLT